MVLIPCNICGRDDFSVRFESTLPVANGHGPHQPDVAAFRCTSPDYGQHGQIVTCNNCQHTYVNPTFEPEELIELYSKVEDETYVAERDGRHLTFTKHLDALEKITGPGNGRTLLDVGAYIGVFVEVALQRGWAAEGIEPSVWGVQQGQRAGLPLMQGTLDAPEIQDKRYDVITMWDVIEHVIDPAAELAKGFELLKPGGVIAVHTMDIGSVTAKLMGGRWPWLMEMHVHFFSRSGLCQLLEKQGFEIIWSGTQGRYLRLGYLSSRIGAFAPQLGRVTDQIIQRFDLGSYPVPVNFGDLFTVYAKKVQ